MILFRFQIITASCERSLRVGWQEEIIRWKLSPSGASEEVI